MPINLMKAGTASLFLAAAMMQLHCGKSEATTDPGPGTAGSVVTVAGKVIDSNKQPVAGIVS
jgi:hypothetical protein